jgi:hypothetical protein
MADKDEKAERLAAALRANLRRRKVQAKGEPGAGSARDEADRGAGGLVGGE